MNNLSPVDRRVYLGTCWKFDLSPHTADPLGKHFYYWIAERRDDEGTVLGTRLEKFPYGSVERQVDQCLMPKLGMTQIDDTEFDAVMDQYLVDF